jgi:hypothetical protein
MTSKFLRYCKVTFYDIKKDEICSIEGGGLLNMARISFEVVQDKSVHFPSAEIKILNLSKDTINIIKNNAEYVSLEAGYKSESNVIFEGVIVNSIAKNFIDSEFIVYAIYGAEILNQKIKIASGKNSTLDSILRDLENASNVKIINKNILRNLSFEKHRQGYQSTQKFITHLNHIFEYYQIEWFYFNGSVYLFTQDINRITNEQLQHYIEVNAGENLIAGDYSARERDYREKYFRERIATKTGAESLKQGIDDIKIINLSIVFESTINIMHLVLFEKLKYVIKSLIFRGDTHDLSDNWKIVIEAYDG